MLESSEHGHSDHVMYSTVLYNNLALGWGYMRVCTECSHDVATTLITYDDNGVCQDMSGER